MGNMRERSMRQLTATYMRCDGGDGRHNKNYTLTLFYGRDES